MLQKLLIELMDLAKRRFSANGHAGCWGRHSACGNGLLQNAAFSLCQICSENRRAAWGGGSEKIYNVSC